MSWLDYLFMGLGVALILYALLRVWLAYRANRLRRLVALSSMLYRGEGCGGISVVCTGAIDMAQLENLVAPDNMGYEVVLLMDGESYGRYMQRIVRRYALFEVAVPRWSELPVEGVRRVWRSRFDALRRITLIDRVETTPVEELDCATALCSMEYIMPLSRHLYLDRGAADILLSLVAEYEHSAECIVCGIDEPVRLYRRACVVRCGGFAGVASEQIRRCYVPVDVVSHIAPARRHVCRIAMLTLLGVGALLVVAVGALSLRSFVTMAVAVCGVVAARIYISISRMSATPDEGYAHRVGRGEPKS